MKVNKSKSPFVSGADNTPDEKDVAKTLKSGKFSDTLAALESNEAAQSGELNSTREVLAQIALQSNLSNDDEAAAALKQSAEILVKSRLSEQFKESEQSEKIIRDLSEFVSEDPLLKAKLLSVLKKLRDGSF